MKGGIDDYDRDEAARHVLRSAVSCRRPRALDRVLREARLHIRRAVGRRDNEHLDAAAGVDGIEVFFRQCVANGATILKPLTPTAWGTNDFYVEDPDGYIICFGGRPTPGYGMDSTGSTSPQ